MLGPRRITIKSEKTNKLLEAAKYKNLEENNKKLKYEEVIHAALEKYLTEWKTTWPTTQQKKSKKHYTN